MGMEDSQIFIGNINPIKSIRRIEEVFNSMCENMEDLFTCELAVGKINEISMNDRIYCLNKFFDLEKAIRKITVSNDLSDWLEKTRYKTHLEEVRFDEQAYEEETTKKRKLSNLQKIQEPSHNFSRNHRGHRKSFQR